MDEWMGRGMDGPTYRWMDGYTDGQSSSVDALKALRVTGRIRWPRQMGNQTASTTVTF